MTLAVIMKMRQHVTLLIGVIGVAIVAFLAMDALNSQTSLFGKKPRNIVGEVEGSEIPAPEFDQNFQELRRNLIYQNGYWQQPDFAWTDEEEHQIRDLAWNQLLEEKIMEEDVTDLGLSVTTEEMNQQITTPNPRNQVMNFYRQFVDPSGQYDPMKMSQMISSIRTLNRQDHPQQYFIKDYYLLLEKTLRRQLLKEKYLQLFNKSTYVADWRAQQFYQHQNSTASINFVTIPYSSIPDDEVEPTENELQSYFDDHKDEFEPAETRDLKYVIFDILPTHRDTATARNWIEEKYEQFRETGKDSLFITRYSETEFDRFYYPRDEIQTSAVDTFFTADTNTFIGPYLEDGTFKVAKVVDRRVMPDSVEIRHILATPDDYGTLDSAQLVIDSLKNLIETSTASFDSLAMQYSSDQSTAPKGGELGYINPKTPLVPNFYNAVLKEYTEGDLFTVETQFGIHLIEILDTAGSSPKVRLALLEKTISPGPRTRDSLYSVVSRFYSSYGSTDSFDAGISKYNLNPRTALRQTGNELSLVGLNVPTREVIQWAFAPEREEGELQIFKQYQTRDDKYVIAELTNIQRKDDPKMKDFREEVRRKVIEEKKKQMIMDRFAQASAGSLEGYASALDVEVNAASNISYTSQFIEGIGNDPLVVALAFALNENEISSPTATNTGVVVIQKTGSQPAPPQENIQPIRSQLAAQLQQRFGIQALENIRENAQVTDLRYKYY